MEANDTEKHFSARLFTNACNSRTVHICTFKYKSLVDIVQKIYKKYKKEHSKNVNNKAKIRMATATILDVYVGLRVRF